MNMNVNAVSSADVEIFFLLLLLLLLLLFVTLCCRQCLLCRSDIFCMSLNFFVCITEYFSGTKGKGSTCAFCESILRHHGLR